MIVDVTQDENGVWSAPVENNTPEGYGELYIDGQHVGELAGPVKMTFTVDEAQEAEDRKTCEAYENLKEIKCEFPPKGPYKPKLTMSRDLLYRVLQSKVFRPKLTRKFLRRNTRGPNAANWIARMFSAMGGGK